ncbi:PF13835 domain protein [Leptospira kirschneri str. JB]|uniref:DUF4194 domain-containing protein n=1 Tax=Leptospira kirschneri TaxID=29507 RepID=UPI0002BD748D|nr:DUF4194 domain-containing protein [Leptospira kirschneri]EMJ85550.1 PF13835 domain protein [Leptospira kirschneri str. JB]
MDFKFASSVLKLLKGPVSLENDPKGWDQLKSQAERVRNHFSEIGLTLHLDDVDCFAFLKQTSDEEEEDEKEKLPVLTKRIAINRKETLLLVLLREAMLEKEEKDLSSPVLLRKEEIYERLRPFFQKTTNEVDLLKDFDRMIRSVEGFGLIRILDDFSVKVQKILKAKISVAELERMKAKFQEGEGNVDVIPSQGE